jgi:hypothetical protein
MEARSALPGILKKNSSRFLAKEEHSFLQFNFQHMFNKNLTKFGLFWFIVVETCQK